MTSKVMWNGRMEFSGEASGFKVLMDAKVPLGLGSGLPPKELVVLGLSGCTAMDVIALLKKYKMPPDSFKISSEVKPSTGGSPIVFDSAELIFSVRGQVEKDKLVEASSTMTDQVLRSECHTLQSISNILPR